jgi:hypothetical protein
MFDELVNASIHFENYDYVINGKPLHGLIEAGSKAGGPNDFGVNGSNHFATSIICQPGTIERLKGESKPDLIHGLTALYVCGYCGGYDGTLIGVHVNIYDETVIWSNIGYSSDIIETHPKHTPFDHIPSYSFKRSEYRSFLHQASTYKVN